MSMSLLDLRQQWHATAKPKPPAYLVSYCGNATSALADYLHRVPVVSDLAEDRLDQFERNMVTLGRAAITIREYLRALAHLRAFAIDRGLLVVPKPTQRKGESQTRRAIYASEHGPRPVADTTMTLADYVTGQYAAKRVLSEGALYQYRYAVRCLDNWCGEPVRCGDLSDALVNDFLAHEERQEIAPATVRNRRRHLLSLWHHAYRHGFAIQRATEIRLVCQLHVPPRAWRYEEVQRLLDAALRLQGTYPGAHWQLQYRDRVKLPKRVVMGLLIRLGWDTGLRWSDIINALKLTDIDDDGTAEIVQHKTRRWHFVKVHAETLSAIHASYRSEREWIVPWEASPELFRREFQGIVRAAGLRGSFKKIRKSSGSEVEHLFPGCGAAHLGHVNGQSIAAKHYIDPRLYLADKPMPRPLREVRSGEKGGAA